MVEFIVDEEFWPFVVSGSDAHIVLLVREVIVRQSPINQSQVSTRMVNHNVQWFDISVHDAMRMRILQRLQHLVRIQTNIHMIQLIVDLFGFDVWDVLEDEARGFCGLVS